MTDYKNWFTLDGRVAPPAGVTEAKTRAVKELVERATRGNRAAAGTLVEAVTTSDAAFNLAHLVNLNFIPQYDAAPRTWTQIAGTRPVSDFRPAVLYSLAGQWSDGVLGDGDPAHVAPVVPEGTAYPESVLSGEESSSGGVVKRGFKTSFTFEAFINDAVGWLRALPGEMLNTSLDTEEFEVYSALQASLDATNNLDAGTTVPTGGVVPINAPLSRDALLAAIIQLTSRTINGRMVTVTGGYNLIVASGQAVYANFLLNQTLAALNTNPAAGTLEYVYQINGADPLAGITVIESPYFTAPVWALVPKVGATRRPILERLQLIGHETPELRVANFTGSYVGGGQVSPFEGSFDADEASYRLRLIGKGVNWTKAAVIWSAGTGVA